MTFSLPQAPQWSSLIKSGCRVFVGGNASVPHALVQHLIDNSEGFSDIELVHMLALGDTRWVKEEYKEKGLEPNFNKGACRLNQKSLEEGVAMFKVLKEQDFVPMDS